MGSLLRVHNGILVVDGLWAYTDDSFRPIGYRALEKAYMGWITPIELTEATTVKDWKSTDRGGTGLK